MVTVADSPSLDPGTQDFSFTVSLATTLPPSGGKYDVMRKGVGSTSGGYYGLEIINSHGKALAVCLAEDGDGHSATIRGGGGTLADGRPHTVTCAKSAAGITATVDGGSVRTKTASGGLGSVGNSVPLVLGAMLTTGDRWFNGSIGDATLAY
jgi:hypothetical protein